MGRSSLSLGDQRVTVGQTQWEDGALTMSDFSSWGVTLDLKLKPEIAAPGGNIYSAVLNNGYANMSGTSMASPIWPACPHWQSSTLCLTRNLHRSAKERKSIWFPPC